MSTGGLSGVTCGFSDQGCGLPVAWASASTPNPPVPARGSTPGYTYCKTFADYEAVARRRSASSSVALSCPKPRPHPFQLSLLCLLHDTHGSRTSTQALSSNTACQRLLNGMLDAAGEDDHHRRQ